MLSNIDVRNTTKYPLPNIEYRALAKRALGIQYELSIVICGNYLSKRLNREHREKDKIANVLSFPLSKKSGELFINIVRAKSEAKKFGRSPTEHTRALFVHGLAHLAGFDHGPKMDNFEAKLLR